MSTPTSPPEQEYPQVNENFRMLADIRFKLLALIPPLGGVAIFLLSQAALTRPTDPPAPPPPGPHDHALVFLLSLMGFFATLGLTFYDQRNNELYNALIGRAKFLERKLKMVGGQFGTRPRRGRRLFGVVLMWHDHGLALIYGAVLGAWFLPIVYSGLLVAYGLWPSLFEWLDGLASNRLTSFRVAFLASLVMGLVFFFELLRFDGALKELWAWTFRLFAWASRPGETIAGKEIALLDGLGKIREAAARYAAANGDWPTMNELLRKGYLTEIPPDPIASANANWKLTLADAEADATVDMSQPGWGDVKFKSVHSTSRNFPPGKLRLYMDKDKAIDRYDKW